MALAFQLSVECLLLQDGRSSRLLRTLLVSGGRGAILLSLAIPGLAVAGAFAPVVVARSYSRRASISYRGQWGRAVPPSRGSLPDAGLVGCIGYWRSISLRSAPGSVVREASSFPS